MPRRQPSQLPFDLRHEKRGGKRKGSGRKPARLGRPIVHARRPDLTRHQGVHVSLRVCQEVGRLRRRAGYAAIRSAMTVCIGRNDFRIVQASIQSNHMHLIVEANDQPALARGLRSFMISAARRLNRTRGRTGAVFERYHMTVIRTPRQARNAIAYVINNWRRHREDIAGPRQRRTPVDPYSSGPRFDGWRDPPTRLERLGDAYQPLPVLPARSWLLTTGWRSRYRLIALDEVPGSAL